MYEAKIIADSIAKGVRLTTFAVTFPRFILAEFNTHRMLSRNSASSRAIPVQKRIRAVIDDPFIPDAFASNKAGMQAGEELAKWKQWVLLANHWFNRWMCLFAAWVASKIGSHKQWANRYIEFHGWHTVVVTATEWENFFALRISKMAQPEIYVIAKMMEKVYKGATPMELKEGEWHLPFIRSEERAYYAVLGDIVNGVPTQAALARETEHIERLVKSSTARCARTSYETHEGVTSMAKDGELYGRLTGSRHMSPHEHPARVGTEEEIAGREFIGNFRSPWIQHRKDIPGEDVAPRES